MGKYFGTDGFRGEANATLTGDHAWRIGRFLAWYYGGGRNGGDGRGGGRAVHFFNLNFVGSAVHGDMKFPHDDNLPS